MKFSGGVWRRYSASYPATSYVYDAWGNPLTTTGTMADTLGKLNPFRYRGYVYDTETGLYYVSSRYYDPEMGRWISSEPNIGNGEFGEGSEILGYNVYAYCCNGVQREHNKKLNNGLPILHKVPPKRDYGRYFCIMAEKGGTSHGGLTEKLSLFFHAKKQEVNAYGR